MTPSTESGPAAAARAAALEGARAYEDVFAERFVAAYLLGSLAYGGYAAAVSDIDLAVVLSDVRDGDAEVVRTTTRTLHGQSSLHRKLSVFWAALPALRDGRADGRFPAADRLELADRGRLVLGGDVAGEVARPGARELRQESARFAVDVLATDEVAAEFRKPRRLLADPVWFTKAVLFPVRFLCTAATTTGRASTNDEAVAWYLAQPQAPGSSLVRLAVSVREGHPLDPAEAAPHLAEGLTPLYLHYVDDQARRLRAADTPTDLIAAFTAWHQRLTNDRTHDHSP